jgi:pimeloyl-ACP methyl ester carboxylesterase
MEMTTRIGRALLALAPWLCAPAGCGGARYRADRTPPPLELVRRTEWEPWEAWRLRRPDRPPLDIFFAHTREPRPLVVLLQGSGCTPVLAVADGGRRRMSSLLVQPEAAIADVHLLAIEKVGVRSFDPDFDPDSVRGGPERCSEEYERHVAKESRVRDVVDAIRAARALPWVTEVLVAGHSEGAEVAAGVGRALAGEVAAVGILSGAGATQLFDFVVEGRAAGRHDRANQALVDAFALNGPTPPPRYRGHSFERWRSFTIESTPLDDLRGTNVPVFVAHGTADASARIENADLFVVELLRSPRSSPLFYWVLDGLDHGYTDAAGRSHAVQVVRRFVDWGLAQRKVSGTELFRASGPAATATLRPKCEQVADRALGILARDGDAKIKLAVATTPGLVRDAAVADCLRDATESSVACMLAAPDLATMKKCK